MALTSRDDLIAALAGGYQQSFSLSTLNSATTLASNNLGIVLNSGWITGQRPGAVDTTAVAKLCTSSTVGAIPLPALTAGKQFYLGQVSASTYSQFYVLDRLSYIGYPPSVSSGIMNLTRPARCTTGHGVNLYWEFAVAPGGVGTNLSSPQITVTYTSSDGVSGRTGTIGYYPPGTATNFVGGVPGLMQPMTLQSGDRGVSSVQSWSANSNQGTGSWGFHLSKIVYCGAAPTFTSGVATIGGGVTAGFFDIGGTPLGADPCLYAAGAVTPNVQQPPAIAAVRIIQG